MKRLFLLCFLAFMSLSCEEIQDFIDPKGHGLVFLEGEMKAYFDDKGDTKNYKFKADLAWSAEVSADWVEVNPTSGPAGENKIKIKVDKNKSNEKRTGYVDITLSNEKSYRIELEQLASGENLDDVTPSTSIPNNEIWYTNGSTTEPTYPNNHDAFGVNIVSNTFDAENERWVIEFDGNVTTIGDYAFCYCSSLTSVTIPDSVTSIGNYAFADCYSLTSVTIGDSVTIIGERAFSGCSSLTSVTIGDSVTTIGGYAFGGCNKITEVNISDISAWCNIDFIDGDTSDTTNVTANPLYAGGSLYLNGEIVKDLVIPSDITEIKTMAFRGCSSLTSVTIPDSVTTIGYVAFRCCSSLTSVTIGDSVTEIGNDAFSNCSSLISVTIPDSVTKIGNYAFKDCSSLTSVTIGDSVTTIGKMAFYDCSSLTSITIGDSVTTIGYEAFRDCRSLTSVTIPDSVTTIGEWAFYHCNSLTSVTIPDSVTTIEDHAFGSCSSLTSITIGDSVTTIGEWAFNGCSTLSSVTIPDSVTEIGDSAFAQCSSLQEFNGKYASENGRCLIVDGVFNSFAIGCGATEYTISDSVTTIGDLAFSRCRSLTSVTIPDSVTTIGDYAFADCSSLTSVYCKAITPPAGGSLMFHSNASGRKIYVPMESVEAYKSASYWENYADAIVGYDFGNGEVVVPDTDPLKPANNEIWYTSADGNIVEPCSAEYVEYEDIYSTFGANIVSNAYDSEKGCYVIKFDSDVTRIGYAAFYRCGNLTSVTIPDSVTVIGDGAFQKCISLTSATIGDGVTIIDVYAFVDCSSLVEFKGKFVGDNGRVLVIDGTLVAFAPAGLTEYYIPDGVKKIGEVVFLACSSLTSVIIPDSVTIIGEGAFFECISLTNVTIGNSVTLIGDSAFGACISLTSVAIPDSVTIIGEHAFDSCFGLTSVAIPDSVITIGEWAFEDCSSLTSVTIGDSVTTIGACAFESCTSLVEFKGKFTEDNGRVLVIDGTLVAFASAGLTEYTIPNGITTIGEWVFYNCRSLTSITIPDSVTTIGYRAFYECSSLTSVTIPDSVTTIGDEAFSYCSSLTSVTIPDSVTTIGEWAFSDCSSLTSVTIPDSVTLIGNYAFYYCTSLTSVYCKGTTPATMGGSSAFNGNASGRKIYVPMGSVYAYKSATGWSSYAYAIVSYNF